jgi:hypothetical protein
MSAEYLTWRKAIRRFAEDLVGFQAHRSRGLDVAQSAAALGVSVEAAEVYEQTISRLMADLRAEVVLYQPSGCRYCGIEERSHFQRWTDAARWHGWTAPTAEQRRERLLARSAARSPKTEAAPGATGTARQAHSNTSEESQRHA